MKPIDPIQMLENDHLVIAKVIGAAPVLADRLEKGGEVDLETILGVIEFMRIFGDKCHHGKDEDFLFPRLIEKGIPEQGGPLGVLTMEHARGREIVKSMADAAETYRSGDAGAKQAIIRELRAIAGLYQNHIWKENNVLFPMCAKGLDANERHALGEQFEQVEERIGQDVHQRMEEYAERVSKMTEDG